MNYVLSTCVVARKLSGIGLKPGMTVADIGTGVGYMLPYLSRAVGPSGHVLAEDIFDDFLNAAKQRAGDQKLGNVAFIKGTETDPRLADGTVDVILALDSYHHYDYPEKMLAAFARSLRDGGRLVAVEYYKRPNAMVGMDAVKHIRLDEPDLVREIERNGFRKVCEREHIKGSSIWWCSRRSDGNIEDRSQKLEVRRQNGNRD